MDKKYPKYQGNEDDFQITAARYLDSLGLLWCHVANERKTNMNKNKKGQPYSASGYKLKRKGVKKGVPDILIFEPREEFIGLAIELKVGYNKPSPEQSEWLKSLKDKGWSTHLTYSLDEFINIVDIYMGK